MATTINRIGLVAGANITLTEDANAKTLTIASTAAGGPATAGDGLRLSASESFFKYAAGATTPSTATITITATLLGTLAGAPTFTVTSGAATLTGSGGVTRQIAAAAMTTDVVTVSATLGGYTDTISISKVRDGAPSRADEAFRAGRTAPDPAFSWVDTDFIVTRCQGPGMASLARDVGDVFDTNFGGLMSGAASYVSPTGSDLNGGGSWSQAFATLDKALRQTANGPIYLWPGVYEVSDFRYSDTFGNRPKKIIAPYRGVTLRTSSVDISAAVWTPNGTYGNVWQTAIPAGRAPVRVLISTMVDPCGQASPLPRYGDLASCDASAFGWHFDSGSGLLSVRVKLENVNTTTKANLRAVYGNAARDSRILLQSTVSYWEGIHIEGHFHVLHEVGQATPQFWAKDCSASYSETHSVLVQGGYAFTQGFKSHRPSGDGFNYNDLNGIRTRGLEVDAITEFSGDVDTYGQAQTMSQNGTGGNKNGSSAHTGDVVRVNGRHMRCFGPAIADTAGSKVWCLGTRAEVSALLPNVSPSMPRYGFLMQGNQAWLDGCSATGNDVGFNSDAGANVRVFSVAGTRNTTFSGTFTDYTPDFA